MENFLSWSAAANYLVSVKLTPYLTWNSISSLNCTLLYASGRPTATARVFPHGRGLAGFKPRILRFQRFRWGEGEGGEGGGGLMRTDFAGSTRLRGHTANWVKFNAYIYYFGARTKSGATEVGYFFSMEGIRRDSNPGYLDSKGFPKGKLDESRFRWIH